MRRKKIEGILCLTGMLLLTGCGTKAYDLYRKYMPKEQKDAIEKLPSTSPANAVFTLDRLEDAWGKVFLDLYPQLDL